MRKGSIIGGTVLSLMVGLGTFSNSESAKASDSIDAREQNIVRIAAFTASGEKERLDAALVDGLESGLTVNEIKEVLVQMYAYAGFPRSLGGLGAFMAIMQDREAKGIKDETGPEASPIPEDLDRDAYGAKVRAGLSGLDEVPPPAAWQKFSPVIDSFLKEHLFADIFVRDVLDFQVRELATIGALANLGGVDGPLRYHLGAAMNTGITEAQMHDFVDVLRRHVGEEQADNAQRLLADVLKARS